MASLSAPAADGVPRRALRLADLFAQEQIPHHFESHSEFSRDGQSYAFGKGRPVDRRKDHSLEGVAAGGVGNADIWVQLEPGQKPRNVTAVIEGVPGWIHPRWSPDGSHLALISVRADAAHLWVWNKRSRRLRQLSDLPVSTACSWLDDRRLLCPTSSTRIPRWGEMQNAMRTATRMWGRIAAGKEPTSSGLDSGARNDSATRDNDRLFVVDLVKGNSPAFAQIGTWSGIFPSPDKSALAYARQLTAPTPQADRLLNFAVSDATYALEVIGLDGASLLQPGQRSSDILPASIRWSTDGREIALLSFGASRKSPAQLLRLRIGAPTIELIDLGALNPVPFNESQRVDFEWTRDGDLIVLASVREEGRKPAVTDRRDWWLIARDGSRRNLTATLKKAPDFGFPSALVPLPDGVSFVGLADGDLWRIDAAQATVVNLTERFEAPVQGIEGRGRMFDNFVQRQAFSRLILRTIHGTQPVYHTIDLKSGALVRLQAPDPAAMLADFSPEAGDAVFYKTGAEGSFVWRSVARSGDTDELMAANTFLREIAGGAFKRIDYTTLEGEKVNGWILLPAHYQQGRRYPLITWVYGGAVYDELEPKFHNIGNVASLNLQIPAARGYAVLLPSMPLALRGQPSDPLLRLTNGVLPALDAAIAAGVADPDRLLVMGHSFGGYCTYGLVTQTNRFKGAVALAGFANLVSFYGVFMADQRYTEAADEAMYGAGWAETGQGSLGGPPWEQYGRYVRNSPILHVDRVRTPVMMIHGDMDYVPMEESEQFYTALHRQGKRAQLVRYWGEGHVLISPANIRDMWARILAWLDDTTDIQRDADGNLAFEGERIRSREGKPGWTPEQFMRLEEG